MPRCAVTGSSRPPSSRTSSSTRRSSASCGAGCRAIRRSRTLVAPATGTGASDVAQLFQPPLADHHWSQADGGLQLVMGMERLLASNLRRFVLLIEEPELYLSPHLQRHLFRVLRELAQRGNQILYSTHAPVFLSVDRIEDLALVRHHPARGTTLFQPAPLAEAEAF